MTALSAQFALADVKPDMVLSVDLLDPLGQVLLPEGITPTEHTNESLHRHDAASVRIVMGELSPEEDAIYAHIFNCDGHSVFDIPTLDARQGAEDLITGADAALYRAKKAGRNQISF